MLFVNHLNETLTTTLSNDYLLEQLQTFKAEGKEVVVLPTALEYRDAGFLAAIALTHEEWLTRKKYEWEDMMSIREEDEEWVNFEQWLEDDIDDLYRSIDGLMEDIMEDSRENSSNF